MKQDYYNDYWSETSPGPDSDPTTPSRKAKLARTLRALPPGARVLDLGCGRGDFTAVIDSLGFQALGVDVSDVAIGSARLRHPDQRFDVLGPQCTIPAEDGTFAAVWSTEVIEHVFDVHEHLAEINRVLADSGIYILTTPYHGPLKNVLLSLTKFDRHFDPELSHIRFFDKPGLQRCLSRAGFEVVSWSGIGRVAGLHRTWFVVAKKVGKAGPPPPIVG